MLYVPQYENLSIDRILEQARKVEKVNNYLPEDRDMHKVPRQWLINVTYTLVGEPFSDWAKVEIVNRNEEIARKQKLLIDMDPEIAKAFDKSANISSKFNHFPIAILIQILIVSFSFSIKWKQCSPSQGWFKASQNAS